MNGTFFVGLFLGTIFSVFFACSDNSGSTSDSDDDTSGKGHESPTDSDSSSDGDADADTDTDNDADTDSDTDSDTDADTDNDADTDSDTDADTDSDTDTDTDTDTDSTPGTDDTQDGGPIDTEPEPNPGALTGYVMAPSGDLPIPGALVYLTKLDPPEIPDHAFDYQCDDMAGKIFTMSGPDGSWRLDDVPQGDWKIVTRKGHFRRIRDISVTSDETLIVPQEVTTLPGAKSADGADSIPNYAVLLANPDEVFNLLAKFGMGETDATGNLQFGTESFFAFSDRFVQAGYPTSNTLFADLDTLMHYHMIFLPCYASMNGASFVHDHADMLRAYVSAGGKIYNSCTVSLWTEAAFPEYIDFYPDTSADEFDVGRISNTAYATNGRILDADLAAWLEVVTPNDVNNYPFVNGYVRIDGVNDVDDGHGLEQDQGVVKPYTWVEDVYQYAGAPLIVTYNFDAGKVFYTVYETSLEIPQKELTPQEYVLLYVILEVGVCTEIVIL